MGGDHQRRIMLFAVCGGAALLGAVDAAAQTTAPAIPAAATPATPTATASASASTDQAAQLPQGSQLQEVVVTAQRRGENIQKVPIAVSAVTADLARSMGIRGSTDISIAAPAVTFTETSSGANITIRGVAGSGSSVDEAANAVYIDGVYQAATPGLLFDLNNIDRIEVEKGPQGTLFGRNSTGGTIQIITRTPTEHPTADLSVGYGNYDTGEAQAYLSGGLTKGVTADLALLGRNQGDGWGTNLYRGTDAYKGSSFFGRSKLRWEIDNSTTATLTFMHSDTAPPQADGGSILPGEKTKSIGGVAGTGYVGFYNVDQNGKSSNEIRQNQVSLNVEHDMNWVRILNITSYSKTDLSFYQDVDAGPANVVQAYVANPVETTTEEFQLQSPTSSKVKWATGFFFFNNDIELDPYIISGLSQGSATNFTKIDAFGYDTSYALYGQTTVPLIFQTNLTFGARYTVDSRQELATVGNQTGIASAHVDIRNTDHSPTFRVSLDHQFTPAILGYVSYNTGYKSGLYNLTSPTSPPVNPEHVTAYEGGFKSELFDRRARFNVSAFHYDFNDIQVRTTNATGATLLLNAASATETGVDVDLITTPLRNLTVQGALTYLDSTYSNFANAPFYAVNPAGGLLQTPGNASGKDTIFSPTLSGSVAVAYKIPTEVGDFGLSSTLYYNGGYYFDPQDRVHQPAYTLLNGEARWESLSGAYEVIAYARNINNQNYYAFATSSTTADEYWPGAPRTFGFTLRYHYR